MKTTPSDLVLDRALYEKRLDWLAACDFALCSSADTEWLTGVPRIASWTEYDPALSEAIVLGFVGEHGVVFSVMHALWHLEAGEAMRRWGIEEYKPGSDPLAHLRRLAMAAGWRASAPVYVPDSMPARQLDLLRQAFPDREFRLASTVIGPLRTRKDPVEVEIMRDVAQRTVAGIKAACAQVGPGVGYREFLACVRREILATGVSDIPYGPDAWATGPSVSIDWANAHNRSRDFILNAPLALSLDVGASLSGYRSDVGRTIWFGEPSFESAAALDVIREARAVGLPCLTPGARAHEVDDATRAFIAQRGFGAGQWIPSGHGIGLEFHDPPVLGEKDDTILADGNVVTYELAIWEEGRASAFAEDTVVIREGGLEWLIGDGDEPIIVA